MVYELIPNMPKHGLAPLMAAFAKVISEASQFSGVLHTGNEVRIERVP